MYDIIKCTGEAPVRPENGPAATVDIPDIATLPSVTPVPSCKGNPGHVQNPRQTPSDHHATASTRLVQEDFEE